MAQETLWSLPEDLAELNVDDPDSVREILDTFVQQTRMSIEDIRHLVEAHDGTSLARSLHRLKGSLLQMGAPSVGAQCAEFHQALASEGAERWKTRFDSLATDCRAVLAEIDSFR
jgi:hypothetical protein